MQRDERWIRRLRGQAQRSDLAGGGVEAVGVDAFALAAFFGVGADVEKILADFCGDSEPQRGLEEAKSSETTEANGRTGMTRNFMPISKAHPAKFGKHFRKSRDCVHLVSVTGTVWS